MVKLNTVGAPGRGWRQRIPSVRGLLALLAALGFTPETWEEIAESGPHALAGTDEQHTLRVSAFASDWGNTSGINVTVRMSLTSGTARLDALPAEAEVASFGYGEDYVEWNIQPCRETAGECGFEVAFSVDVPEGESVEGVWSARASLHGHEACGRGPVPEELSVTLLVDE